MLEPDEEKQISEDFLKILNVLPESREGAKQIEESWIDEQIRAKHQELDQVSETLSKRVMDSYDSFVSAMGKIQEVELDLNMATVLVKNSRRSLATSDRILAQKSYGITRKHHHRQQLTEILDILQKLQALLGLKQSIRRCLDQNDCAAAIGHIRDCYAQHALYSTFDFLQGFTDSLQGHLKRVSARLDMTVRQCCSSFDSDAFERLLRGYHALQTSGIAEEHAQAGSALAHALQKHSLEILRATARVTLASFIHDQLPDARPAPRAEYPDLCALVPPHHLRACLLTVLEQLAESMGNYAAMLACARDSDLPLAADVHTALVKFRATYWDFLQRKVNTLLAATGLSVFKLEQFFGVLAILNKFMRLGEAFSRSNSFTLESALKTQMHTFYENFHSDRASLLCTLVENEEWCAFPGISLEADLNRRVRCAEQGDDIPSDPDAVFRQMMANGNPFKNAPTAQAAEATSPDAPEYAALPPSQKEGALTVALHKLLGFTISHIHIMEALRPVAADALFGITQLVRVYLYTVAVLFATPSSQHLLHAHNTHAHSSGNHPRVGVELPPGSAGASSDSFHLPHIHLPGSSSSSSTDAPFVHLHPPRLGKALSRVQLFLERPPKHIASQPSAPTPTPTPTLPRIPTHRRSPSRGSSGPEAPPPPPSPSPSPSLPAAELPMPSTPGREVPTATLSEFTTPTRAPPPPPSPAGRSGSGVFSRVRHSDDKTACGPSICPTLSSNMRQFGIGHRVVAAESLVALIDAFQRLRPHLESVTGSADAYLLDDLYNDLAMAQDLRMAVYRTLISALISFDQVVPQVLAVKWDGRDLNIETSPYVLTITREFAAFLVRLSVINDDVVTEEIRRLFCELAVEAAMNHLVDGYSKIRKISDGGRTLMNLDIAMLKDGLTTQDAPPLQLGFLQGYAASLHLQSVPAILQWCQENPQYKIHHMVALPRLSKASAGLKKKDLQEATRQIEALCKGAAGRLALGATLLSPTK